VLCVTPESSVFFITTVVITSYLVQINYEWDYRHTVPSDVL